MRKWLKNVSFMILLFKSCILLGQDLTTKTIVVIDPGHGGKDSGAIGKNNLFEKDIVLRVAEEIVMMNSIVFDNALDIYLTRQEDNLISLNNRTRLAKALKADVFISLHCNHASNPNAKGIEIYVADQKSEYSATAVWLAYRIQGQFQEKLGYEIRGVKFANFQVLREAIQSMPSVLVELGFLSNIDERGYYQKPNSYRAVALVILDSLIEN